MDLENYTYAEPNEIFDGTSFSGCVDAWYRDLVKAFGPPNFDTRPEVTSEWLLVIDGHAITICSYPNGPYGHIGGHRGDEDVALVHQFLAEFLAESW